MAYSDIPYGKMDILRKFPRRKRKGRRRRRRKRTGERRRRRKRTGERRSRGAGVERKQEEMKREKERENDHPVLVTPQMSHRNAPL